MRSTRRWTAMSGLTSQPCLGSIVEALRRHRARHRARPRGDPADLVLLGGGARPVRAPSRATSASGASEVYLHEMPGGQFTNLKEQARSLGLETRWHEVAQAYADVNQMFGDIVKVTPSSKVVGDMALMMVAQGLTADEVRRPGDGDRLPGLGRRRCCAATSASRRAAGRRRCRRRC